MNEADIAQVLLQTTGSLTPVGLANATDLEEARSALVQTLLNGIRPEQLISEAASKTAKPTASHTTFFDDTVHVQIQKIASAALTAHSAAAAPKQLAYFSSLSAPGASAPQWAVGMTVAKTLGPFEDSSGIPFWVHFFNLTRRRGWYSQQHPRRIRKAHYAGPVARSDRLCAVVTGIRSCRSG